VERVEDQYASPDDPFYHWDMARRTVSAISYAVGMTVFDYCRTLQKDPRQIAKLLKERA